MKKSDIERLLKNFSDSDEIVFSVAGSKRYPFHRIFVFDIPESTEIISSGYQKTVILIGQSNEIFVEEE